MKVTSPVGEYPYVVRGVRIEGGRIVVEGSLGVWETTMEIEPADWAALGRRLARPLAVAGAVGLLAAARRRRAPSAS
jgi:hypothetical protein